MTILGRRFQMGSLFLQWKKIWAIAFCCMSLIAFNLFLSPIALAQDQIVSGTVLRTLTVTGQYTEKIPATLADVQLGVQSQGATAQQVQQEVTRRSTAVVALLKSRNVERLRTAGIGLSPQYRDDKGRQVVSGFGASNSVSFRVPSIQAGSLIDAAIKSGASQIDNVSFTAADQAVADAQKVALTKATQEAQAQGVAVLSGLGLSPKEIVNIQLNGATLESQQFSMSTRLQGELVAPRPFPGIGVDIPPPQVPGTPIEAGEQSVQASVTLRISY